MIAAVDMRLLLAWSDPAWPSTRAVQSGIRDLHDLASGSGRSHVWWCGQGWCGRQCCFV